MAVSPLGGYATVSEAVFLLGLVVVSELAASAIARVRAGAPPLAEAGLGVAMAYLLMVVLGHMPGAGPAGPGDAAGTYAVVLGAEATASAIGAALLYDSLLLLRKRACTSAGVGSSA